MAEEKATKEVKGSSSNMLSHNICETTFKNILRGNAEDVMK